MAGLIKVTDADFEDQVLKSALPVLVACEASWCGPWKTIAPKINQIADERTGGLKVVDLDTDENPITARNLGIRGLPVFFLFKDGVKTGEVVGANERAIRAVIDANLP